MIRRRITVAVVAVVAVAFGVAGLAVLDTLERRFVDDVDAELTARAEDIQWFLENQDFVPGVGPDGGELPDARGEGRSPFDVRQMAFLRLADDGEVLSAIGTGPANEPDPLPDVDDLEADGEVQTVGSAPGGPDYRALVIDLGDDGAVVLAVSLDQVDESMATARQIFLAAGALTLVAAALLVWAVVRRGLRPIGDMIVSAERIADGEVTERVPVPNPTSEVGHLGTSLNTMLDRLNDSMAASAESEARMRRFLADASHELRTPLTSIRGYAELFRTDRPEADKAEAMQRVEQEATRMGVLVEDLLLLARLDQGRDLEAEPVDLVPIVGEAADAARTIDTGRRIEVTLPSSPVVVLGDRHRLRQAVDNLLANVRHHTPEGTEATVQLVADGSAAVIEVTDDGPGMTPEELARARERFWQADAGDRDQRRGAGLGLAITEEIVHAHGGAIDLRAVPGEGTTVRLSFPRDGGS